MIKKSLLNKTEFEIEKLKYKSNLLKNILESGKWVIESLEDTTFTNNDTLDIQTKFDLSSYKLEIEKDIDKLKIDFCNKIDTKKAENANKIKWYDNYTFRKHNQNTNSSYVEELKSINSSFKFKLELKSESIFNDLKLSFPHFKEVIDFYKSQFRLNKLIGKKRIEPVLLLGDAGIGKTLFAKRLAQALETGYTFIDMGSCSSAAVLSGHAPTWSDAKQGRILEAMADSPTISPVVLLDELEKCGDGGHHADPRTPLFQLLEENTAKEFTDEFFNMSFDVSGIIYVACANTLDGLSEPLLSRFKVFTVELPREDDFANIVQQIYTSELNNSVYFSEELSKDIIDYLNGKSLREVKSLISEAIAKSILEIDDFDSNGNICLDLLPIQIKLSHFKKIEVKQKQKFGF